MDDSGQSKDGNPADWRHHEDIEADLLQRLQAALEAYQAAAATHRNLFEQAKASNWKSDAARLSQLEQAAVEERRALQGYGQILDAFCKLILGSRHSARHPSGPGEEFRSRNSE